MSAKDQMFPAIAVGYAGIRAPPEGKESPECRVNYLATLPSDQMWAGWFRYTSATYRTNLASFYSELISKEGN